MAKHIGIVGCSAEGAALCYRTICLEGAARMGRHDHPEISMHTHPLARYTPFFGIDDWDGVARLMIDSAERVHRCGAEFAICPDNTIHQSFDTVARESPIPWLHIADEVAKAAKKAGFTKIGVLGTRYLMEGPVYPEYLGLHHLDYAIPSEKDRERINQIIFDELVYAVFTDEARAFFNDVMARLANRGCDAAVLGCTEIPLLVIPDQAPLPTLDSTRLLARAALEHALA